MKKAILALLFVGLLGCGEGLPVRVISGKEASPNILTQEEMEVLEEASALLGFPFDFVDKKYGAVNIELVNVDNEELAHGRIILDYQCTRIIRSNRRGVGVAHEIGHALRLDVGDIDELFHVEDDDNIMSSNGPTDDATFNNEQLDALENQRGMIAACR